MTDAPTKRSKKDEDGDISRIEKREARLRASFEAQGGVGGEMMRAIVSYFSEYRTRPRPHLFLRVIERVRELHLMTLPEHRYGVAGGLAAVFRLHPEYEDEWKAAEGVLLENAEQLAPPITDEAVERPTHVDYLWMHWLVTGDQGAWQRVYRLAHRTDEVGVHARLVLRAHQGMPEVQQAMEQLKAHGAPGVTRHQPGVVRAPIEHVNALGKHLLSSPGNHLIVVLVGWVPGDPGSYLVITPDGNQPPGCPATWQGLPVLCRVATAAEMAQHHSLIDAGEDP